MKTSYEIDGICKSFEDWCKEYNRRPLLIQARLSMGMSLKEALTMIDNARDNLFCIGGVINTFQHWCKYYNVSSSTVKQRLKKGWSANDAFSIEVDSTNRIRTVKYYDVNGEKKTLSELSSEFNINQSTISSRIRRGESIYEALDIVPIKRKSFTINEDIEIARYKQYEMNGEIKTLFEWCKIYNVPFDTIKERMLSGNSIKDAFLLQVTNKPKTYEIDGIKMTISEISEKYDVNKHSLKNWLNQGISLQDAIAKKPWTHSSKYRHIQRLGMHKISGEYLKIIRESRGLSQYKLVELFKEKGVSLNRNAIRHIERNEWLVSDVELDAIIEILKISKKELGIESNTNNSAVLRGQDIQIKMSEQ